MTYEEALTWGIEHGLTIRFWKQAATYRVWVCKVIDEVTEERIVVDEMHPDVASALQGVVEGVEMIAGMLAEQDDVEVVESYPALRLVHSA